MDLHNMENLVLYDGRNLNNLARLNIIVKARWLGSYIGYFVYIYIFLISVLVVLSVCRAQFTHGNRGQLPGPQQKRPQSP